jgi:hypothetical protein
MKKIYNLIKSLMIVLSLVTLQANAQLTYCSISGGSTNDDEIFNVTFGSLNNSSTCGPTTGGAGSIAQIYTNFTGVTAPVVIQGFSYPLSVVVGQCNSFAYGGYVRAWIDYNQNGVFTDPGEQIWTSAYTTFAVSGTSISAGNITIPVTATPGTTRMRVTAMESGLPGPCTTPTWGEVEDYNIFIITPTPCSSTPGANSVVTPTAPICPNSNASIFLANSYTVVGITYQWQSSTTSSVGPFTAVSGATNYAFTTPNLTAGTWYQTVITCTNTAGSTTAVVGAVQVAATTTNTVPYYESFEGISAANKLPNCSWIASATPTITQTYVNTQSNNRQARTGSKFAAFYGYYINGTNYFYSNGIQMEPGITYSASVWFTTEYYGHTNFTEFAIMLGTAQSSTGLVNIASKTPAASAIYSSLTNTFTVATSGLYYVAIKATSNGQYGSQYLSWDDLAITIPCSLNSPSVTLSASSQTICEGQTVNLTATGADTYLWNTGATGANVSDTPNNSIVYSVVGTNSLTGCSVTLASQMVVVNETPSILIYSNKPAICAGQSANLSAMGATTYTWSNNATTGMITVSPNATTTYTVLGSNAFNCVGTAVQQIIVNQNPTITVSSNATNPAQICKGEAVTLTGNGAVTYSWAASSLFIVSPQAIINPMTTTTYTVYGANSNGCTGMTTIEQVVAECTGINEATSGISGVSIFPNPTTGIFIVELNNNAAKTVQVSDLTGRVVMTGSSNTDKVNVNISSLANGIYYVKIQSNNAVETIKVVKN